MAYRLGNRKRKRKSSREIKMQMGKGNCPFKRLIQISTVFQKSIDFGNSRIYLL